MHVQIVTYSLQGMTEQDYIDVANQVATQFSATPGLLAKIWLEDAESNVFGAVYFWEDHESMERFSRSDLFEGTYPGFANVVSEDYAVYENLTRLTQPVLQVLEEGWVPPPVPPAATAAEPTRPGLQRPAKAAKKATKAARKTSTRAKKGAAKKGTPKKAAAKKAPAKKATGARKSRS